jgi:hypothetical protein
MKSYIHIKIICTETSVNKTVPLITILKIYIIFFINQWNDLQECIFFHKSVEWFMQFLNIKQAT